MIAYYKTVNGRVRLREEFEEGCWVNVVNPDEREINSLIHQFSLEQDFIRAALDEEESSRIEAEDGNTLIILDAPVAERQKDEVSYYTLPLGRGEVPGVFFHVPEVRRNHPGKADAGQIHQAV